MKKKLDYRYAMTGEEIWWYGIPNPEYVMWKLAKGMMPQGRIRDYDRDVLWKTGYLLEKQRQIENNLIT